MNKTARNLLAAKRLVPAALIAGAVLTGCLGSNGKGPKELDAPIIPTAGEPLDLVADIGGNATFSVIAEGEDLSYVWVKNGRDTIPGATGETLTLEDVKAEDFAGYSAIVSNSGGSVKSRSALLHARRAGMIEYAEDGINGQGGVFEMQCAGCHNNGIGFPGGAPPLANADYIFNNRDHVIEVMLRGGFADTPGFVVNGMRYAEHGGGGMPSFSWLSDFDLASVLTYIRAVLNDSLVTSCEPYDPEDPDTYDENGFAFCTKVARDSADIATDSVAVWEITAMRDSLVAEGLVY
jgi:mono/diheme cytochrome c family protein